MAYPHCPHWCFATSLYLLHWTDKLLHRQIWADKKRFGDLTYNQVSTCQNFCCGRKQPSFALHPKLEKTPLLLYNAKSPRINSSSVVAPLIFLGFHIFHFMQVVALMGSIWQHLAPRSFLSSLNWEILKKNLSKFYIWGSFRETRHALQILCRAFCQGSRIVRLRRNLLLSDFWYTFFFESNLLFHQETSKWRRS